MENIIINGLKLTGFSSYFLEYEQVGEYKRAISGLMVADIVAKKARLRVGFEILEDEVLKEIFVAGASNLVDASFFDGALNGNRDCKMFVNISPGSVSLKIDGKVYWKNVEVVFIEQ